MSTLKGQTRLDRGGELRSPKRLPNGSYRFDAVITRSGVFVYRNPDGTLRREYRPPEEVGAQESLESAEGAPITDDHPPELLELDDIPRYSNGSLLGVPQFVGGEVIGSMVVADAKLLKKMQKGKREVSSGYKMDLYETPGVTPDGERYDAVQRNIRYNHVAIVDRGRAGPNVRVRMDAVQVDDSTMSFGGGNDPVRRGHDERRRPVMGKTDRIDNSAIEAAAKQLAVEKARADSAEQKLADETARADEAEGRAEALQEEVQKLRSTRIDAEEVDDLRQAVAGLTERLRQSEQARKDATDPKRIGELVKERVKIETAAKEVLGDEARLDDLTDRQIMVSVVEKLHGKRLGEDRSDQYVSGQFDTAMEGFRGYGDAVRRLADGAREIEQERHDTREKRTKGLRDMWKQPLPNDIRARRTGQKEG